MDYIATSNNIKISPRKVRLVAEMVKHMSVDLALRNLGVLEKRAAMPVKKTLESAIANAVNNFKVDRSNLSIKEIMINEGLALKRFHFAARGRTRPYKRRSSNIRIVLSAKETQKEVESVKEEKK